MRLEPWQAHFIKDGTSHGFTNDSATKVQFLEAFVKKTSAVASLTPDHALAMAMASLANSSR